MYKVYYKSEDECKDTHDLVKMVNWIEIDVSDIDKMKYIDVIYDGDIYLLLLYTSCLKYYHSKPKMNEKFVIENKHPGCEKIINSILECSWLINEDDVIVDSDNLKEKKDFFETEIDILSKSNSLKNIHKCILMQHFIDSYNELAKNQTKRLKIY